MLEKTLERPLDWKEIQPFLPKGDQFWVFTGRTDVEAETPILWPPDANSWLIWKDPDAQKDWGQEEKGMTEDEMVGWHHRLDRHGFGWTPGVGDGQGGLACCSSWGRRESDMTEWLNWMPTWKRFCLPFLKTEPTIFMVWIALIEFWLYGTHTNCLKKLGHAMITAAFPVKSLAQPTIKMLGLTEFTIGWY